MKTWAKVVLCVLCIVFIGWVVAWYMFFHAEKKITTFSTYCMDSVRAELSDHIWNVVLMYGGKDAWAYLYSWSVSYEWVNYDYTCAVKAKDDVELTIAAEDEEDLSDDSYTTVSDYDLSDEDKRIAVCEERAWFYLNFNEWEFSWEDESEAWASFVRDWHVKYVKWGERAEEDVNCFIDMVDNSVTIKFSNHVYNWKVEEESWEVAVTWEVENVAPAVSSSDVAEANEIFN